MADSLTSSTVKFEVDASSGQLGTKPPITLTAEDQRAEERDFLNWGVRADVIGLYHGTFEGKPASVISFEFRFLFDGSRGKSRFSEAKITTTLQSAPESDDALVSGKKSQIKDGGAPVVKLFSPKKIVGPVTIATCNTEKSINASVSTPVSVLTPQVGFSRSSGEEYPKGYKMEISGKRWNSAGEKNNMVIWTLLENSKEGDGVPTEFRTAILVQHDGSPFQGTIKISVHTKLGLKLFGWPWSSPNPLKFQPTVTFGEEIGVLEFEKLDDSHWEKMCSFPGVTSSLRWTDRSPV